MSRQTITNPKGAFGSTDVGSVQEIATFRNMSTVQAFLPGQCAVYSSLVGDGNECIPGTTVQTGLQRFYGVAVSSCSTNTNTTNQTSAHPGNAWVRVVTRGPVMAFVTSAVEKGDVLVMGASTVAPALNGRLTALTTAGTTGAVHVLGWAMTSGTSGTTNPNGRVFVAPGFSPSPTS